MVRQWWGFSMITQQTILAKSLEELLALNVNVL